MQRQEPDMEWSDLLDELMPTQRHVVAQALRSSAHAGWPASREVARSLVDYARGRITSQEYAVQVLVALGYADPETAAALIVQRSRPSARVTQRPVTRFDADVGYDFLSGR